MFNFIINAVNVHEQFNVSILTINFLNTFENIELFQLQNSVIITDVLRRIRVYRSAENEASEAFLGFTQIERFTNGNIGLILNRYV